MVVLLSKWFVHVNPHSFCASSEEFKTPASHRLDSLSCHLKRFTAGRNILGHPAVNPTATSCHL